MRIIISGGGTGGHIYPARAIYDRLDMSMPDCEKMYIGSKFGIEHTMLKDKSMNFKEISARPFLRGQYWYCIISFFYFIKAIFETFFIMKKFKPDLVMGMGGFVSGPVVLVAHFLGIDTFIHEQNVVPGLSTEFLSRFATKILYSYKESIPYFEKYQNKIFYTGNPVRNDFVIIDREKARKKIGLKDDELLIVSMGGSNGAQTINDLSFELAKYVDKSDNLKYIHITGKYYKNEYNRKYDTSKLSKRIVILGYTDDMPNLMSAADIIISRSGAITLAEIAVSSVPSILIPSPNVARDHQTHNALAFEKIGGSIVMLENELDKEKFIAEIDNLVDHKDKLASMRRAYKNAMRENALNTIISLIYDYNLR